MIFLPMVACVAGVVWGRDAPIPGATVRVQRTSVAAVTNPAGEFKLCTSEAEPLLLTAAASGYYIAGPVSAAAGASKLELHLTPIAAKDDPAYRWVSPFKSSGNMESCEGCHSEPAAAAPLPFEEWLADAHGRATANARFLSVYRGTDLSGEHRSPLTEFVNQRDYGRRALKPDPDTPYFGPGFQLDFPGQAGNCAACHAPVAAAASPYQTRSDNVGASEGITCDFCHKISGVKLDSAAGRPYPNTPGVLSFEFRRPGAAGQLFLGSLDDATRGNDVYSPLHKSSAFCAPCHSARFWGVPVYDSFGEWLDSSYSRGPETRTCQDCHMQQRGATHFAKLDAGGLQRNPKDIPSHLMRGPDDADFMSQAARLDLQARRGDDAVSVTAVVTNSGAGHALPTGHPGRNMMLIIDARDETGVELPLLDGPVLPVWSGLAGHAGRAFAQILEERWTGNSPTISYWAPIKEMSDTRIPAMHADSSEYAFRIERGKIARVTARLIYRRTFPQIGRQKGWTDPGIEMHTSRLTVPARAVR